MKTFVVLFFLAAAISAIPVPNGKGNSQEDEEEQQSLSKKNIIKSDTIFIHKLFKNKFS